MLTLGSGCALAQTAAFDLTGPSVDVRVQRDSRTLPIGEVPNLMPGDRLWVHAQLPETQSARYLMIVAFLRGSTNPPPDNWFTRVETWNRLAHEEGVYVTVPDEAQQALVFLAPEAGSGLSTVRSAVRGKPGAFVRAAQDLQQASLDRTRLEVYLRLVREDSNADAAEIKERSGMLARSLNMKLDQQCFDKPTAQQVPCLTQNGDSLVLDDAHTQNMVAQLTSGSASDLLSQITSTPSAGAGYFSPYVGAVVDTVRILNSAHSAQYQYIPALALPEKDRLDLRLNNPPSFRNPKSVLVVALPPVGPTPPPPLRAVDPKEEYCAQKPGLVLPMQGAPLVFATGLAHDFVLHLQTKTGPGLDLPAKPDPTRGGFVVDTRSVKPESLQAETAGVLHGSWGFQHFEGPTFRLRSTQGDRWIVESKDASALIVGRTDLLHLTSDDAACVESVSLRNPEGRKLDAGWKNAKPGELEVQVPLQSATPGRLAMLIKKFGIAQPDEVPLHTYSEAGSLDAFMLHAGDAEGVLKGTRLDEVKEVELNGAHFAPESLLRANQKDELRLAAKSAPENLHRGDPAQAHITLKDGRVRELAATIESPRPQVKLISKSVQLDPSSSPQPVKLGSTDELPQEARLNFFLKAVSPETFTPSEKVEVATVDESFRVLLSFADGNLTLQDAKTELAVLDPLRHLGPSAFGPLKFRAVDGNGAAGDWQPLANLVRIPTLTEIQCVPGPPKQCSLVGEKLYLIDAVGADPAMNVSVQVPEGFVDRSLPIPTPKGRTVYLRLRDDPGAIASAVVPAPPSVAPPPAPPASSTPTAGERTAAP